MFHTITEGCIACEACVAECPAHAIETAPDGRARIIDDKCIDCGACVAVCPTRAVSCSVRMDRIADTWARHYGATR